MIRVAGGIPVPVPLREENGFTFDLDFFDQKISKRTKMVILNSPGNPTGSIIPFSDLEHIASQVCRHDCWVLSDEVYSRLVYDGHAAHSIIEVDGMAARTVIADGFSKTYSMTGWRLGYSISPPELAERLELLATHATGCPAAFTQYAALEAINGSQEFLSEMVREYQSRRDRMLELVNAIPGLHALRPEGAFYIFANISGTGMSSRQAADRLMDEAGVAVLAGTDFGSTGEGYLRLVYAVSPETIEEGMQRIKDWFLSLS
jgi:aspartate aminotransferase